MKKIAISLISLYQIIFSPLLKQMLGVKRLCGFNPSCSVYTKLCLEKYGLIKGTKMGIVRIFNCRPKVNLKSYLWK